jgi:hypothetical protein
MEHNKAAAAGAAAKAPLMAVNQESVHCKKLEPLKAKDGKLIAGRKPKPKSDQAKGGQGCTFERSNVATDCSVTIPRALDRLVCKLIRTVLVYRLARACAAQASMGNRGFNFIHHL